MLNRKIEWWESCEPSLIARAHEAEIEDVLLDAKKDILWLNKMLKAALRAEENAMEKVCDLEDKNADLDKAICKMGAEKKIAY
jgi:hypothetical protein